jgi:hypothetical protein
LKDFCANDDVEAKVTSQKEGNKGNHPRERQESAGEKAAR